MIVGHEHASESLALRTYGARLALIHDWLDADSPTAAALIRAAGLRAADLPAVILPHAVLSRASPGDLAHALGLTGRAAVQALKFGAQLSSPCDVAELGVDGEHLRIGLANGAAIAARAAIVATGARYRRLALDGWDDYLGSGIYYAATEIEARAYAQARVVIVGGGNSAGQAALFLASRGCEATLAVRGAEIGKSMSAYLVDRVLADPRIEVRLRTEVTGLEGDEVLRAVTLNGAEPHACEALFCFVGAVPETAWLSCLAADADGFLRTDAQLETDDLGPGWEFLGRRPLPFECSVPGVFAAGDVRSGSIKRVAAAVGEGASAVRSVHAAIGASRS